MAHASIMTFNDPNGSIRVKTDNGKVYIYWQVGTYLALNQAETLQLRDDLSRAITETATAGDGGTATAGDYGTATAGDNGTATAAYKGTATAGNYGTATAGDNGTATAAYKGTATAGNYGTATAGNYGTATAGNYGTATAGYNGELRIRWYDREASRYRTAIAYVGENGIEADAAYRLDDAHQFVKVTP